MKHAAWVLVLLSLAAVARAEGDAARGKTLYEQRCTACHSIDYNGAGPAHKNLLGRRAGTFPGFAYSVALKGSSIVWTDEALSSWLENPEKFVPGQKMFVQTPDPLDRADLIAYLKQATKR